MTDAEFRAWLARDNEQRCILVELEYIYESLDSPTAPATGTLYLSDREFFDDVTDNVYVDCVRAAPQYTRALSGEQLGAYISSIGSLELDNADGELDFALSLAIDGSPIRFYYGGAAWPVSDFRHIFTATASRASAPAFDRISVALKDTGLLLDKSIGSLFAVGGTGPNAEKTQMIPFGYIHNQEAFVYDEPTLLYAFSDGGFTTSAEEVRDRGVSVAYTPSVAGAFTLSAAPDGLITCDVLSEPMGAGNTAVSDAFDFFIGQRAGLTVLGLYDGAGPTFTVHDVDDYLLGVLLSEPRNAIELLRDICDSGNCFWAVKRTGEFTFGRLRLNDISVFTSGSPPAIVEVSIVEDDIDQGSFKLEHMAPQYYKYQAFMSRNWVKQSDLASSLNADEQAVFRRDGIYLVQPDATGTTYAEAPELYHKTLAISPTVDTLLSEVFSVSDVDSLAQWMTTRRAMFLPWVEVITIVVGIDFYTLELGDPVRLFIAPRMGEDDTGTLFQVIGIVLRLTDAKIELRLARRNVIQPIPESWTRLDAIIDDSQPPYQLGPSMPPPIVVDEDGPRYFPPGGIFGGGTGFYISGGGGTVVGGSTVTPPPQTFNKITIVADGDGFFGVAEMRLGTRTTPGTYTSEASFTSANPGLTLEDFSGVADPASYFDLSNSTQAFSGVTVDATADTIGQCLILDSAYVLANGPPGVCVVYFSVGVLPDVMTFTFGIPVSACGFRIGTDASANGPWTIKFYDGASLLHTETISPYVSSNATDLSEFIGYATTG